MSNIEIICVDGGPMDGTLEILNKYAACDKRINKEYLPGGIYADTLDDKECEHVKILTELLAMTDYLSYLKRQNAIIEENFRA